MRKILLTRGKYALVDDEDFEWLNLYNWSYGGRYAVRSVLVSGKWKQLSMHRAVMGDPKGKKIDHIDGNPLNNQKINLRTCTHAENLRNRGKTKANTSGYKGVYKNGRGWMARVEANGRTTYIGTFKTKEAAARAYDIAAVGCHGEFAKLNLEEKH